MTSKQITVRLPECLADELARIAAHDGQRVGTVANHMLANGVARHCGLKETPPEWRVRGIGEWERERETH